MTTPTRIAVTGAFGNVGRNTLPWLIERGHRVRALAHGPRERRIARAFADRVEIVEGDVRDRMVVDRLVRDVDTVVHLAFVIPPTAHEQPDLAESVNVGGTRTLLDAIAAQPRPPRVLFASTLDVYGHTTHLPPPRRVGDALNATDNYTAHKIACESMVQSAATRWCIFRFADVPPIEVRSPHPIMFRIPLETRIEVIHPRDAGLAIANALDCDDAWGRIWNIGGGAKCQLTYGEYLGTFLDVMGIGRFPPECFSRDPYCTDWLDTADSEALLHYQRHTFDDVVRETGAVLGWRRTAARVFRPLVRRAILRMAPRR